MKREILSSLSIGLLAFGCTNTTPRMSGGGGDQTPADSGVTMMDMDTGVTGNPDATTMVEPDAGFPDTGVDFTRDPSCPMSASWITTVSGHVTDEMDNPVQNAWAQLCLVTSEGTAVCLSPEDTLADGSFEILVPVENRCLVEMTMRNLVLGENRATMYCHLGLDAAQSAYEVTESLKLYPTVAATMIPPEGDKEMVRTVEFSDGLNLSLAPKYFYGEYEQLAAATVDPTGLCFVENPSTISVLYAFSPEGTAAVDFNANAIREIAINIPVPSTTMVSPGDTFDLYVLGGLGCPDPNTAMPGSNFIKEGTWAKFGTGTVNSGGTMIESDMGVGIPCLTWVKAEKQ